MGREALERIAAMIEGAGDEERRERLETTLIIKLMDSPRDEVERMAYSDTNPALRKCAGILVAWRARNEGSAGWEERMERLQELAADSRLHPDARKQAEELLSGLFRERRRGLWERRCVTLRGMPRIDPRDYKKFLEKLIGSREGPLKPFAREGNVPGMDAALIAAKR